MSINHQCCSCMQFKVSSSKDFVPLHQTMDEMAFERGIWQAAINNDLEAVLKFISRGHTNYQDSSGFTALHYASRNGYLEICKVLLQNGACINCKTSSGKSTPLHRASSNNKLDIVKLLLDNSADIFAIDIDGKTALHKAVENKHHSIVTLLLSHCNDLRYIKDNQGKMADENI